MSSDAVSDARTHNYHYKVRATHAKSIQLTQRDFDLLAAVHTYRVLHRGHIHDLFFTGLQDEGGSARRRLLQLFSHGYLERIPRFISPPNNNPGPAYRLAARGAAVLADRGKLPLAGFNYWGKTEDADSRSPKLGHAYLEHNLMLADIRLAFEKQAHEAACTIDRWIDYHDLRSSWKTERVRVKVSPHVPTEDLAIAPDGYFVLATGKGRGHFFVEADRGTETIDRQWRRKILAYKEYLRSGKFHHTYKVDKSVGFRVLTIAASMRRAANLHAVAERFGPPELGHVFMFTGMAELQAAPLSSPIWLRGSTTDLQALV